MTKIVLKISVFQNKKIILLLPLMAMAPRGESWGFNPSWLEYLKNPLVSASIAAVGAAVGTYGLTKWKGKESPKVEDDISRRGVPGEEKGGLDRLNALAEEWLRNSRSPNFLKDRLQLGHKGFTIKGIEALLAAAYMLEVLKNERLLAKKQLEKKSSEEDVLEFLNNSYFSEWKDQVRKLPLDLKDEVRNLQTALDAPKN